MLPKIEMPLFNVTVPSTGEKVQHRPFTVKEERILLIAQESKDFEQAILATKQIVSNCISGISINDLAIFDIEYLLLKIRAKSVDNVMEFRIMDDETKEYVEVSVNIDDIEVHFPENHSTKIKIDDRQVVVMRYPTMDEMMMLGGDADEKQEILFDVLLNCVSKIVIDDTVYDNIEKDELVEFIEGLPSEALIKMKDFFETMPSVRREIPYKNSKGKDKVFVLEGNRSFFM